MFNAIFAAPVVAAQIKVVIKVLLVCCFSVYFISPPLGQEVEVIESIVVDSSEDPILPGFNPLVVDGAKVMPSSRVYEWRDSYLPTTWKSKGTLVADGVKISARVKGKYKTLKPALIVVNKEESGRYVQVEATGRIEDIKAEATTRVEYDGVAMVRMCLKPRAPRHLSDVKLEFSISKSKSSTVIAYQARGIRKQQNRDDILDLPYRGPFLNVIGIADGEKSFWWFADNAKGWKSGGNSVTTVTLENGRIKIVQKLIDGQATISEPVCAEFNFLVTPVREWNGEWRANRIAATTRFREEALLGAKYRLWWTTGFAHDTLPYVELPKQLTQEVTPSDLRAYPGFAHNAAFVELILEKHGIHMIPYFSAHALSSMDPAIQEVLEAWEIKPPMVFRGGVAPFRTIVAKPMMSHRNIEYSNYVLKKIRDAVEQVKFSGVYLDHGFPVDSLGSSHGWVDSEGVEHPSLDILGLRDFIRRLRQAFVKLGLPGYVFVQASNREIIPAYTFATAIVSGEQYQRRSGLVNGDYISLVPLDEVRIRFSPGQYGLPVIWLAEAWKGRARSSKWWESEARVGAYRNHMAMALLHDVPVWAAGAPRRERANLVAVLDKFGLEKSKFFGYWDEQLRVHSVPVGVIASAYYRADTDSALGVFVNTGRKEVVASPEISIDGIRYRVVDVLYPRANGSGGGIEAKRGFEGVGIEAKAFTLVRFEKPL